MRYPSTTLRPCLCLMAWSIAAIAAGPADEGLAFYQAKDYPNAFRVWNACAQKGDGACQYQLGLLYNWGRGVPHDANVARKWFESAAAQRHAYSMYQLGLFYRNGDGVPKDEARALKFFEDGIAIGCDICMEQAGYQYWKGIGTAPNPERAFVLLYLAAPRSSYAKDTLDKVAATMQPEEFEKARAAAVAAQRGKQPSFWTTWPAYLIYGIVGLVLISQIARLVRTARR
ncbi:MAG: tetratricopeptide repeat protein [Bryobacteraceae bacterium]